MNIIDKINSTENFEKDLNSSVINKLLIGFSSLLSFFSAVLCVYCFYVYNIIIDKYKYLPSPYSESFQTLELGFLYNDKFVSFLIFVFINSLWLIPLIIILNFVFSKCFYKMKFYKILYLVQCLIIFLTIYVIKHPEYGWLIRYYFD